MLYMVVSILSSSTGLPVGSPLRDGGRQGPLACGADLVDAPVTDAAPEPRQVSEPPEVKVTVGEHRAETCG